MIMLPIVAKLNDLAALFSISIVAIISLSIINISTSLIIYIYASLTIIVVGCIIIGFTVIGSIIGIVKRTRMQNHPPPSEQQT